MALTQKALRLNIYIDKQHTSVYKYSDFFRVRKAGDTFSNMKQVYDFIYFIFWSFTFKNWCFNFSTFIEMFELIIQALVIT